MFHNRYGVAIALQGLQGPAFNGRSRLRSPVHLGAEMGRGTKKPGGV